ncbi:MAG: DUF2628 domain-containing protein [Desulfobacterales bacterium]|nr:DUF2628 domain-containing protein [Desulfobacterales bacterium]MCP4161153.1 DUF2628 domain-containing protein [Deltaproteobacteria bacterium]
MKTDLKDPKKWIPKNVFEAYCGPNSEKLLSFYDKAVEKKNMNSMSLNWGAILLLPAWLGYRKQWVTLLTLTVIFAILPFVEGIFQFTIPSAGFTGGLIVIGLMCNSILLAGAHKDFLKLKQSGMDEGQIINELKDKVSPSVPYAIISLIAYVAIIFSSVYIAISLYN